jgi:hypothetical protein
VGAAYSARADPSFVPGPGDCEPPFKKALRLDKTKNSASRVLPTLHEQDINSVFPKNRLLLQDAQNDE